MKLTEGFNLLATAPDGIKRLRELILSLAVQGKLVLQDANDEPASELLKHIREEKDRLIADGKIKKDKPLPAISDDEKPFELPEGWDWVRLGDLGYTQTGGTPSKNETASFGGDVPFIKPGDIFPNSVEYKNEGLSTAGAEQLGRLAPTGSILMVCIGTIGKCNLITQTCAFNQQINSISPLGGDSKFWLSALRSAYFQAAAWARSSSTTIAILNKGKWESIPVPIAPALEQSRVVAKVEELMVLCDALETRGVLEAKQHARLTATLFDALAASESAHQLQENWTRLAQSFDLILNSSAAVDALEQTLLQLAVRGLLVEQDPNDEPASELLKQIRLEKDRLIAEGKIKKDKPQPAITDDEKPFDLPSGWEWVRVANVFNTTSGGSFDADREQTQGDFMYVKVGDMNLLGNELVITTSSRFITPVKNECSGLIPSGSIIFPKRGGAIATNKKRFVIEPIFVDLNTMAITPIELMSEYAYLWLQTIDLATLNTGTSVPQINHKDIDPLLFSLPPIKEQARIVARVEALRALCADLRQRLTASQKIQTHLAETLVEQAA